MRIDVSIKTTTNEFSIVYQTLSYLFSEFSCSEFALEIHKSKNGDFMSFKKIKTTL